MSLLWMYLKVFLVGGALCAIGELLVLRTRLTPARILVCYILTGVLLSLCHFLYPRLHPRIVEIGEHADGSLRSRAIWSCRPCIQMTQLAHSRAWLTWA